MEYNFITNIESCYYDIPSLVYYVHIPAAIVAAILGLYIYFSQKSIQTKAFLGVVTSFVVWVISNLLIWVSPDSRMVMFFWDLFGVITAVMFLFAAYFGYVFIREKDLDIKYKVLSLLFVIPLVIFIPYALNNFDITNCEATENIIYSRYYYAIGLISLVFILKNFADIRKADKGGLVKKVTLLSGVSLFVISFYVAGYVSSLTDNYSTEQYGIIGMVIFLVVVTFLIVRYKAFDIKLLATQALIWTLIILVGSQFFFIRNPINYILNGITFVGAIISGIMIVRSVKRVDTQREQLALANQEQETLVHFITHQIKGYFTKSRNIFDTLTDMENVPESALRLVSEGLRSDKEGVELVENILNAANMKNGKMKFENKEIDLDSIVKKIIADTSEAVAAKKIKLNYYCSTSPVKFIGDEFRMRDVLKNLIQNAICYTFEGGITIYLNQKVDHVEFIVQDTGIGLTDDDKRRLFTSGGRGVESVKYNVSSTGYGLFIVKKVIDNYSGRIWAESEGRNKGSKFTLILPLV
jgi:signal transduction histidine kinase